MTYVIVNYADKEPNVLTIERYGMFFDFGTLMESGAISLYVAANEDDAKAALDNARQRRAEDKKAQDIAALLLKADAVPTSQRLLGHVRIAQCVLNDLMHAGVIRHDPTQHAYFYDGIDPFFVEDDTVATTKQLIEELKDN